MSAQFGQAKIRIRPLTPKRANDYVVAWHRHHGPLPGGFAWFAVGAVANDEIVGVAIAGRPTNRNNDDGMTVEVLRVATCGFPNAASALLGACARAALALGAERVITYTLESESGKSLRGAGWQEEKRGIVSWWTHGNTRPKAVDREHMGMKKVRWAKALSAPGASATVAAKPTMPTLSEYPSALPLFDER